MTDREILTVHIEYACAVAGKTYEEHEHSISIVGGPKYIFTEDGQIKSVIRDGKSYGPDGTRRRHHA